MMQDYNIVRNESLKAFWVSEPKNNSGFVNILTRLKEKYGKENIIVYPISIMNLDSEIALEEQRGNQKAHYIDWLAGV